MDIGVAVFLGIVQGVTEWLPISSSGHLVILQHFFGVAPPLSFDIFLHVATLLVVMVVFRHDLWQMFQDVLHKNFNSANAQLAKFILIGSIPTALIGFFFHDFFEALFTNPFAVGIALLINGTILFLTKFAGQEKALDTKKSLLIGTVQGIAIIPGISRSGMTISTGILSGIKKETAITFSFLLYVPAALGGMLFKLKELTAIDQQFIYPTLVGFITAFIVGYLSLKLLIRLVQEKKFHLFAFYCWLAGIVVLILL